MTVSVGSTRQKQAEINYKNTNPGGKKYCGMCGLEVVMTKDYITQLTSAKVTRGCWIIHLAYACGNCNCTTAIAYTTKVDPEPYQDSIGLYA